MSPHEVLQELAEAWGKKKYDTDAGDGAGSGASREAGVMRMGSSLGDGSGHRGLSPADALAPWLDYRCGAVAGVRMVKHMVGAMQRRYASRAAANGDQGSGVVLLSEEHWDAAVSWLYRRHTACMAFTRGVMRCVQKAFDETQRTVLMEAEEEDLRLAAAPALQHAPHHAPPHAAPSAGLYKLESQRSASLSRGTPSRLEAEALAEGKAAAGGMVYGAAQAAAGSTQRARRQERLDALLMRRTHHIRHLAVQAAKLACFTTSAKVRCTGSGSAGGGRSCSCGAPSQALHDVRGWSPYSA